MTPLFEEEIEQQVRLPWQTICRLAVKALIAGMSLNDIVEQALRDHLAKESA